MSALFTYRPITSQEVEQLHDEGAITSTPPIDPQRLSVVSSAFINFDGESKTGKIMVLDCVASAVCSIFESLYDNNFPIHSLNLVNDYNGDDDASMEDNNTSCFNSRPVTGGGRVSKHSCGLAIDINPVLNPYVWPEKERLYPPNGKDYINRSKPIPGMVEWNDRICEHIFYDNGFTVWGANFEDYYGNSHKGLLDYHHFHVPDGLARTLCIATPDDAKIIFETHRDLCDHTMHGEYTPLLDRHTSLTFDFYNEHPNTYMKRVLEIKSTL